MQGKEKRNHLGRHITVGLLSVMIMIGGPAYAALGPSGSLVSDTVSSATVVIEQPSGAYVVLINRDRHPDQENLDTWISFFEGREIGYLFEDISCAVPSADSAGMELAKSFQSRLPENQMLLRGEETTLLLSKALYGNFDVILLSREVYDASGAKPLGDLPFVEKVESEGMKD